MSNKLVSSLPKVAATPVVLVELDLDEATENAQYEDQFTLCTIKNNCAYAHFQGTDWLARQEPIMIEGVLRLAKDDHGVDAVTFAFNKLDLEETKQKELLETLCEYPGATRTIIQRDRDREVSLVVVPLTPVL